MKKASHRAIVAVLFYLAPAALLQAGLLGIPDGYTPEKSWPVIVCTQDGPSRELTSKAGYFLIHAGGKGVEAATKMRNHLLKCADERTNNLTSCNVRKLHVLPLLKPGLRHPRENPRGR